MVLANLSQNLVKGQTPSAFGGQPYGYSTTLYGYSGGDGERPLVFNNNVRPNKNGDEPSISPFFNNITYLDAIDMDEPCKGPNQVLVGMDTRVKHLNVLPSLNGTFPQPLPNAREGTIGLAHTQNDIVGQKMKILKSPDAFNFMKPNPLGMKIGA